MKVCFLFPGQGAQYPGMGKDLWESSSRVKDIFAVAKNTTGIDVENLIFQGTDDDLKKTDNTQIAMTVVNLSASAFLKEKGIKPEGTAGFSLGEWAALVESGVLRIEDIFPAVRKRGELMEKASRALDSPEGNPGMAAVIGLDFNSIKNVAGSIEGLYVSNYNSPVQSVVSGTDIALKQAEPVLKEKGAKRIIRLNVSGPFHSPLLKQASNDFAAYLENIPFNDPIIPFYSNVTGALIKSGKEAKELCAKQIVSTVQWVLEEEALIKNGFTIFYETGPGTVLTGLLKAFNKDYKCSPAGTLESINNIGKE